MNTSDAAGAKKQAVVPTKPKRKRTSVSALRPLAPRMALVERVIQRVRQGIFEGEFPLGSELPSEGELASDLDVSYTVVREAMRVLRAQGMVEVSQGRRPRVKPAGPEPVRESLETMLRRNDTSLYELTELRRPLECEIAALAAQRATPEQLAALQKAIDRQAADKTIERQIEADSEFHILLAGATGNSLFPMLLSAMSSLFWESRRRTISRVGSAHALNGHRAVLSALHNRDPEAARAAMLEHITMVLEDLAPPGGKVK